MRVLLDTNVVVGAAAGSQPTLDFINGLTSQGFLLCICDQTIFEFWSVATRSQSSNGLGLSIAQAESAIATFRQAYNHVPVPIDLLDIWLDACVNLSIGGRNSHDARIACQAIGSGITYLATLDQKGFSRFTHLTVLSP